MKNNLVLNVKRKLLQMLLDSAELALLFVVKIAERIIACKISLTRTSAKLVTQELLKQDLQQYKSESMNPNLLKSTMTSLESRKGTMGFRKSNKKKTPLDPIYICSSCARRKHMPKAEKLWIREGKCDFCLERTYICQAIDYIPADITNQH
jgi:hypothetical protein